MTKEYLQKLDDYLIGDLDNMIEKADEVEKNAKEGQMINQLSVPIAMSIFSALDVIGFLLRNKEEDKCKANITSSSVNIAYSIYKWDSFGLTKLESIDIEKLSKDNLKNTKISSFINNFRHGMAHSFFHKNFYINNKKICEENNLFFCSGENLYFNVRAFYKSFKIFYSDLKKYLENEDNILLFDKNLQLLINHNNEDVFAFKLKLKTIYCDEPTVYEGMSGTSGTSGLSGTSGPSGFSTESFER